MISKTSKKSISKQFFWQLAQISSPINTMHLSYVLIFLKFPNFGLWCNMETINSMVKDWRNIDFQRWNGEEVMEILNKTWKNWWKSLKIVKIIKKWWKSWKINKSKANQFKIVKILLIWWNQYTKTDESRHSETWDFKLVYEIKKLLSYLHFQIPFSVRY